MMIHTTHWNNLAEHSPISGSSENHSIIPYQCMLNHDKNKI